MVSGMRDHVYRICEAHDLAQARVEGELPLSPLDRRDGCVHLSTARQVPGTLARYFAGRDDLVLLTIDRDGLVDGVLTYEAPAYAGPDEPGPRFPHFHGRVATEAIVAADALALDASGRHVLPASLSQAIAAETDDPATIDLRGVWDPRHQVVFIDHPRPSRIDDEAGVRAWGEALERRLEPLRERHGPELLGVIGVDNLELAPALERRYAALADDMLSRWFDAAARWATTQRGRELATRVSDARSRPHRVFTAREAALAFVLEARAGPRRPA